MPYVDTRTAEVYYESHGEGPAILFAHGTGGHHAIWWQQIPHFRDRYRVLTIDFPGFGLTKLKSNHCDVAEYSDCILAVLDDAGVGTAVLVGQSLGCAPSLRCAVDHPDRVAGVVLCHQLGGIDDQEIMEMAAADRAQQAKLPVIDRLMTKEFQETRPEMICLFQEMSTYISVQLSQIANVRTGWVSIEQVKDIIALGIQVTYLEGGRDAGVQPRTYAKLREKLPEAEYEYVAEAAHSYYWEMPQHFNLTLSSILSRVPSSGWTS